MMAKATSLMVIDEVVDQYIIYDLGNYKNSQYYGSLFIGSQAVAH